ncbi:hypothetical protein ASF21_12735 [Arthrobacter sp. Leaf234]|uniref:hypothetical protein n=1 Tax=Arthrobacter sp. Leaf234 TaxID=1736303 RepID=UPI0006FCAD59|nr:hypothetical protein [Arthrobacter sp. Leaf234]KQN99667.1 hypothetical protein ASF21_12735 [Arthrobacter sp. Leaf234]
MVQILQCDEGGSVTCAILEVARSLQEGPSAFEVLAIGVIPLLAALASIGVLYFSVVTAQQAKEQAQKTERARVQAERDRIEYERQLRFERSVREVLVSLSHHLEQQVAHRRIEKRWRKRLVEGTVEAGTEPDRPFLSSLIVLVGAAKIDGDLEDQEILTGVRAVLSQALRRPMDARIRLMSVLPDVLVRWLVAPQGGEERRKLVRLLSEVQQCNTAEEVDTVFAVFLSESEPSGLGGA